MKITFSGHLRVAICISLFLSFSILYAARVPPADAGRVAGNFAGELYSTASLTVEYTPLLLTTFPDDGEALLYVYSIGELGFVLISGDDEVYPVLGWSLNGTWTGRNLPPALTEWITSWTSQIQYIRSEGLQGDQTIRDAWKHYLKSGQQFEPASSAETSAVGPLLTCRWNQNTWYNFYCPADIDGPGGRALAGCVATAMGQVMYYYRYPVTGTGSSSYYHNKYGQLTVNHSNTTYRWNEMGDLATSKSHQAIAELLYHLGVSVQMNYGPNASGAYSQNAALALKTRFNYDPLLNLEYKNSYSDAAWANLLRSNLDAGHPMYYHGYGSGGHAFNVDGYQGTNHFHFNWGWGGSYDGYFYLTSLNPGTNSFTSGQGAIVNFRPPASAYPYFCSGTPTLTALAGSLEDGSGPVSDYLDNTTCTYLIEPTGLVSRIEISMRRFLTEENHDILYIHDGNNQQAPLLATLSGDTIPPMIVTTGGAAFLRFVSNATQPAPGWMLLYEAFRPVFCTNLQTFTTLAGTFDDGSGPNHNYNTGTNCKYYIQTGINDPVRLSFNYFSIEDGKDYLRIYDPTTVPSTLLATYTGQTLPPDVIGPKGQLMLIFYSDNGGTELGWEVTYSSLTGLQEPGQATFEIFPNPAKSMLFIRTEGVTEPGSVVITDLAGRQVRSFRLTGGENSLQSLDLSGLSDGIYLIVAEGISGIKPQRLVIRNH